MTGRFYDIICIGSGFASMFFLHKALEKKPDARALILERGGHNPLDWQVWNRRNAPPGDDAALQIRTTGLSGKTWPFTIGLGGSSNCWWANTPRILPAEFELFSLYGTGTDWPVTYDDLEAYYTEAEYLMQIAGDDDNAALFPRSRPYPQPPHRYSTVSKTFRDRFPGLFFAMPQARARTATAHRNPCCSNSMCGQCPVNAKFTLLGDMPGMFQDARIDLHLRARAEQLETMNDRVGAVVWRENGALHSASADLVVLGANGIFNPHLLLKSGIADGPVGLGLQEQLPLYAIADLDGLEDGDGSAHATGIGYNFADGPWRKEAAGGFYELTNLPLVRPDPVKWRQTVRITFMLDDLRQERNRVIFDPDTPDTPVVRFEDYSEYAHSGRERIEGQLGRLLSHLPVEDIRLRQPAASGHAHLQGTAVMGRSPRTSVVDGGLLHHRLRNLVVAGSSAFPTAAGANPTLTIAALSLRAADRLY